MKNSQFNESVKKIRNSRSLEFLQVNHILFIGLVLSMIVLGMISHLDLNQTQMLPGMTEARGFIVNFQEPVEVKSVLVQSGQMVAKGDLLFELSQSDLSAREYENKAEIKQVVVGLNIHHAKKLETQDWLKSLTKKEKSSSQLLPPSMVKPLLATLQSGLTASV